MRGGIEITSSRDAVFKPAPIPASQILAGNPTARNSVLFTTDDKLQFTLLWHCTAGTFRWYYDEDETVMVLEGGMTIHFDDGSQRQCGPGDIVFFAAGGSCVWVIEKEVRKIAFFREPAPQVFALPIRLARKAADQVRRVFRARPAAGISNPGVDVSRECPAR